MILEHSFTLLPCLLYTSPSPREAAEIKKAKDTAEVIVTEAVKEAQRYADGLKKQSAEKLSEAVGIVKDTLLK